MRCHSGFTSAAPRLRLVNASAGAYTSTPISAPTPAPTPSIAAPSTAPAAAPSAAPQTSASSSRPERLRLRRSALPMVGEYRAAAFASDDAEGFSEFLNFLYCWRYGQAVVCLGRGAARTCIRCPWLPCTLRISTGSSPAGPNQCGRRVSNSATSPGSHRDVVLAEDQPHFA